MLWLGSGELQEALCGLCLDFVGTHLCEGNRALKAESGGLIFLGIKFPRETVLAIGVSQSCAWITVQGGSTISVKYVSLFR